MVHRLGEVLFHTPPTPLHFRLSTSPRFWPSVPTSRPRAFTSPERISLVHHDVYGFFFSSKTLAAHIPVIFGVLRLKSHSPRRGNSQCFSHLRRQVPRLSSRVRQILPQLRRLPFTSPTASSPPSHFPATRVNCRRAKTRAGPPWVFKCS